MPIQYDLSAALPRSDVVAVIVVVVVASFSMKMIFMENTANASEQKITEKKANLGNGVAWITWRMYVQRCVCVCIRVCVCVCMGEPAHKTISCTGLLRRFYFVGLS